MNPFLQLIQDRRSIKRYQPKPVPEDLIEQVISAGLWAPSGMNKQGAIILAITDSEIRNRLSRMNAEIMGVTTDPFYGAPVVLVVLADKSVPTSLYDGSLVMGDMMLAAHALGLGSCWIHRAQEEFATEEGQALLTEAGIKGEYEGVGHCILGYADETRPTPPRREGRVYHL